MQTAKRRRSSRWAIGVSLAAHAALFAVVALQRPMLATPTWEPGPPEPIIPVLILPRTPPPTGGQAAPIQPIRLHRRLQPHQPTPVAPLPVPEAVARPQPAPGPPEPKSVPAFHPAPQPEGPKGDVKQALRQSYAGCANQDTVGLNRAERDKCDEKFGKGAKDAAFAGLGLNPDKLKGFDAVAAEKARQAVIKGAPPERITHEDRPGRSAEDMADSMGIPPKPHPF